MAEIEIHHEHGHAHDADPFGRRVGVLVAVIGIFLSAVTIESHRTHTAAIVYKTEANDQWAFYQAKKIRGHMMDVGATLLDALGSDPARTRAAADRLAADRDRYAREADGIQKEAEARERESRQAEHRALLFDLGEGLLELGLVLSSLYFLSKRRFFPALGSIAALGGLGLGIAGLLV